MDSHQVEYFLFILEALCIHSPHQITSHSPNIYRVPTLCHTLSLVETSYRSCIWDSGKSQKLRFKTQLHTGQPCGLVYTTEPLSHSPT